MRGWVYIAENDSLQDMVKIGYTDRDPNLRLVELSGTGLPTPFRLCYTVLVEDPERLEQEMHRELSERRVNPDREFFNCKSIEALNVLKHVMDRLSLRVFYEEGGTEEDAIPTQAKSFAEWRINLTSDYRACFRRLRKAAKGHKDLLAIDSLVNQELIVMKLLDEFFGSEESRTLIADENTDAHSLKAAIEDYFNRSKSVLINFKMVEVRTDQDLSYEYQQMVSNSSRTSLKNDRKPTGFVCYYCKKSVNAGERCSCRR